MFWEIGGISGTFLEGWASRDLSWESEGFGMQEAGGIIYTGCQNNVPNVLL
jgi:hypothetical protein